MWIKRTDPPIDLPHAECLLFNMAVIEQRLRHEQSSFGEWAEHAWAEHPDAHKYRRLMCDWWQLSPTETTRALKWAYTGGLKRYGLPEIHNRMMTSCGRVYPYRHPDQLRLTPTEHKVQRVYQRLRGSGSTAV